ncbi:peptidoglycan recognition protein [Holotrichia oblita]|uniref:Peptidoglycan recognition protein n=2 Tax=Holotrichia oblita TaxID=644536 RepID=A0ACB9T1H3_HOLOL|nr:peptidoglycan recognition protein [Holotrichia oblita]KAI4460621.1 peptidoglycan recognition protein [Holotrichia oblita]
MKLIVFVVLLCIVLINASFDCPKIISRSRWGARPPKQIQTIKIPVEYIIIHHTVTPTCLNEDECSKRLINIQNYHMDVKNYNDISYSFMVGGDAQIYEGVGWNKGSHTTPEWDSKSIGIGFVGNFSVEAPKRDVLDVAQKLIRCGVAIGDIHEEYKLLGARSLKPTESPGDALYKEIQDWKGFVRSP